MPVNLDQQLNSMMATQLLKNISDPWISIKDRQPEGAPIVFMYSESNNEFSYGHFTLNRGGVPVTHWMPCVRPKGTIWGDE